METQYLAAIPNRELIDLVDRLDEYWVEIGAAVDMVFTGY